MILDIKYDIIYLEKAKERAVCILNREQKALWDKLKQKESNKKNSRKIVGKAYAPHNYTDPKTIEKHADNIFVFDLDLKRISITEGALKVIDVLQRNGHKADLVGGCVRDAMLGMVPKDEDITTDLDPQSVKKLFKRNGFIVINTGIKHGTVTVFPTDENHEIIKDKNGNNMGYEVTTYRIDGESTDHRHPDSVEFTSDIKKDMARRDFTINAMAYDPFAPSSERIKDFFGGRDDLRRGVIRTVGNPEDRIEEDALRMMRAIRFSVQKDMEIDECLAEAIKKHAPEIVKVSQERIRMELEKILVSKKPDKGIRTLYELGLLSYILPDVAKLYSVEQNNPWHLYDVGRHTEIVLKNTPNDLVTRLAALFHDTGKAVCKTTDENGIDHFYGHPDESVKIAEKVFKNMNFSNKIRKDVFQLIEHHDHRLDVPTRKKVVDFIKKYPNFSVENMYRLFDLQVADSAGQNPEMDKGQIERTLKCREIYTSVINGPFEYKDLALSGKELSSICFDANDNFVMICGPDISFIVRKVLDYILDHPERNNVSDLVSYVKNNLKNFKYLSASSLPEQLRDKAVSAYKKRNEFESVKKEICEFSKNADEKEVAPVFERYHKVLSELSELDLPGYPSLTSSERKEVANMH